jgi:hypothetical protein
MDFVLCLQTSYLVIQLDRQRVEVRAMSGTVCCLISMEVDGRPLLTDQLPDESQSRKPDHAPHSASYLEVRQFSLSKLVARYRREEILIMLFYNLK